MYRGIVKSYPRAKCLGKKKPRTRIKNNTLVLIYRREKKNDFRFFNETFSPKLRTNCR